MTSRIVSLFAVLCLGLGTGGLCVSVACAQQEVFPFLAEVTGDQVNVRSGQSVNFERLCQLNQGDEVIVVAKEFSWYKIQLPSSAKSYISKEYVQFLGQNAGGIIADRVNIRAGAGIQHTVLGQLTRGEQIYIEENMDGWYRIQPVEASYGWVSDQFLTFKSSDTGSYKDALPARSFVEVDDSVDEGEELPPPPATIVEAPSEPPLVEEGVNGEEAVVREDVSGTLTVTGYPEPYEDEKNNDIRYRIVSGGKILCYVQGLNHMLGRFSHQKVQVEGDVNPRLRSQYALPVIIISKVRLML